MEPTLYVGNSLDVLKTLPDNSVDSVVTDPPYEISFMSKKWDSTGIAFSVELWTECLRVIKPGGHLLSFGATRSYHRMVCAIEDAGFEIRDSIHWTYGSGFPKSLNISKALDKAAGAERLPTGVKERSGSRAARGGAELVGSTSIESLKWKEVTAPATPAAEQWEGWGTALKPSHEPIVVARKPMNTTVAENVLTHGTGALNVDGCRVGMAAGDAEKSANNWKPKGYESKENIYDIGTKVITTVQNKTGRWPANTILGHSVDCERETPSATSTVYRCTAECPVLALNKQSGDRPGMKTQRDNKTHDNSLHGYLKSNIVAGETREGYNDTGGASRFFQNIEWSDADDLDHLVYQAKAGKKERPVVNGVAHATVKPLALMRYLVRLVTPVGGVTLDPFAGSGTTMEATILEGAVPIGVELTPEHVPLIQCRMDRQGSSLIVVN